MALSKLADQALQRLTSLEAMPQPALIRLRYPVVLMHGFGLLAGIRRGGHLHEEALNLRLHGVWAYAPNVAPYNTVPVRSEMWRERIAYVLEETGADKVNLVAHSMGGLDARYLISVMGLHAHVASLVTVSTPHHGTALAPYTLEQPERVRAWISNLFNWMGTNAVDDCTADFVASLQELTPEYMADSFNPSVPNHPNVRYWSFAGAAGKGTGVAINPLLRPLNTVVYNRSGINDGFVPVESAKWGTFRGTIPADHSRQIGIHVTPGGPFHSNDFYREIAEMLAAEGF